MMKVCLTILLFCTVSLSFAADPYHIYAPSRASGKLLIVRAETDADGKFSLKLSKKVELGFLGSSITQHREKPFLYIGAVRSENEKTPGAVVTLDEGGKYLGHRPVAFNHPCAYMSLDRANRFLLCADYFGGNIHIYSLDRNGIPGKSVVSLNEGRTFAHCVLPSPDNRFVYIPYVKENNALYQYQFNPDNGKLTALEPLNVNPPEGTGPRHMAYHPAKPVVYFSNEQHLGVSVYDKEKGGSLKLRQICDAVGEDQPQDGVSSSDILITPDGRFLFAGIRGHKRDFDRISRYRIKESGEVELLGLTPADKIPWGLALSPDGNHLLVSAYQGGTITAFEIGDRGDLKEIASLECDLQIADLVAR